MGSAAAALLPGFAPGVSGAGHSPETEKEASCALPEAAQFIIGPGPFRSPSIVQSKILSMNRAGPHLAVFQLKQSFQEHPWSIVH